MKKSIRKVLSTLVALTMCYGTLLSVSAKELTSAGNELEVYGPPEVEQRYIVSCPGGGKHFMKGRGTGYVRYGVEGDSTWVFTGTASQCQICNLVLITENNPFMVNTTHPWGRYATASSEDVISGVAVTMFTKDIRVSNSNTDPYAQGFNFQNGVR